MLGVVSLHSAAEGVCWHLGSSDHCRACTIHCHDPVDDYTPLLLSYSEWVLLGS